MTLQEMNSPVSDNVKRIIVERGIKQKHIAERCGVSEDVFSRLINGKSLIKPYLVVRLADALGVSPGELFG